MVGELRPDAEPAGRARSTAYGRAPAPPQERADPGRGMWNRRSPRPDASLGQRPGWSRFLTGHVESHTRQTPFGPPRAGGPERPVARPATLLRRGPLRARRGASEQPPPAVPRDP